MRVAIVHYHLEPGGVTSVIRVASEALTAAGVANVVLTGEQVPGLGYLTEAADLTADELVKRLRAAASDALGGPPDVWHLHNHSLGKNRLMPEVISRLAEDGERLVLQIHDLAEQGRPENYQFIAGHPIYPFSPRIRYAFLNTRDLDLFVEAGLPRENAVVLSNPVPVPCPSDVREIPADASPLLFAPIRGIRRKNIGEMVLLSALAPAGTRVAISRAPKNPDALRIHETWRNFAEKHRLPIGFDVVDHYFPAAGADSGFSSWVAHATHFVTTSVSEGFGLPFLESVAHGKPLLGRDLPHLTSGHDLPFPHLYQRILVPLEWVDLVVLESHLTTTLERNFRHWGRPLHPRDVVAHLEPIVDDGWIDFGNLPEPLQQGVIERLADTTTRRTPLVEIRGTRRPLLEWLEETLAVRTPAAGPDQLTPWSPETCQGKLRVIYQDLVGQPSEPVRHVPPGKVLSAHLAPASFHFLLSVPPPGPATIPFRAVAFDIYGTLLDAPAGGVKPDPFADPVLREVLRQHGHEPSASPSADLHAAVLRHHAASDLPYPEIDLRVLWREVLSLPPEADTTALVLETEAAWHPATLIPGAAAAVQRLSRSGLTLGLLSNAQCNTLGSLGGLADLFSPEFILLSYQQGISKPAPELFEMLADRLAGRGITPAETLYIGNDPLQDIAPAAAAGFRTALFTGHPASHRPGECSPDFRLADWKALAALV